MIENKKTSDIEIRMRSLVMETRFGNKSSYKTLLAELAPILRKSAMGGLAPFSRQAHAEDITQEALLAIHLKLHTYDESMPFLAWARAVTKHKMIDYLRRNKVRMVSIDDQDFGELADTANPEVQAITYDLKRLLDSLKPPAGQIIYAMKVEGATIREISTQYNMTESNIKVIIHRGLQKLADKIKGETQE